MREGVGGQRFWGAQSEAAPDTWEVAASGSGGQLETMGFTKRTCSARKLDWPVHTGVDNTAVTFSLDKKAC